MAKTLVGRLPECEKWQKLQMTGFRRLRITNFQSTGDEKSHLLTYRYVERVRKMTTAQPIICRKAFKK